MEQTGNKIIFFGCPLDCDEKYDAIMEKRDGGWPPGHHDDPIEPFMAHIADELPAHSWENIGSVPVPNWLRPKPDAEDRTKITTDEFIGFMDRDGCRDTADAVQRYVTERILPNIPCMVAVDHSLTGGAVKALAGHYGRENLSLVVVDSHTDAIPMNVMAGAIQYDIDTNPATVYDRDDPFLYNRTDSYNASSFVHHMVEEALVAPQNLFIIGVSDYPEKRVARIKDPRIADYVGVFRGLKQKGVKIVTKKDCKTKPTKLKTLLKQIRTSHVYVSIDMDIGARNALEGVRFTNWQGLNEKQIYKIADEITSILKRGTQLAGMDVNEFNVRKAGMPTDTGFDSTYRIAANLVRRIAFLDN